MNQAYGLGSSRTSRPWEDQGPFRSVSETANCRNFRTPTPTTDLSGSETGPLPGPGSGDSRQLRGKIALKSGMRGRLRLQTWITSYAVTSGWIPMTYRVSTATLPGVTAGSVRCWNVTAACVSCVSSHGKAWCHRRIDSNRTLQKGALHVTVIMRTMAGIGKPRRG